MRAKEEKAIERKKYKLLTDQNTQNEMASVKRNVDLFLSRFTNKNFLKAHIAIYWPLKNEIDLRGLRKKYPLALPKCKDNNKLEYYSWDDESFELDFKGIPSPNNLNLLSHKEISIIFTPCLSVDRKFTRLGYGGGYFDKLRSKKYWADIPCIGILTEKCVSKELLFSANWDIPLSGYITERKILV